MAADFTSACKLDAGAAYIQIKTTNTFISITRLDFPLETRYRSHLPHETNTPSSAPAGGEERRVTQSGILTEVLINHCSDPLSD